MESVSIPIFSEIKLGLLAPVAAGWSAAFLIYLWVYAPWLIQTLLDGKDG